jgi:hypothetical protein
MPSLSEVGNEDDLENRYLDKVIVYVEGPDDERVFHRLLGFNFAERLEFKAPLEAGSGCGVVLNEVGRQRAKGNRKIYGLLDGEAAAAVGQLNALLDNEAFLFSVAKPELDGILFLAEHEVENILLRHADVFGYITNDAKLGSTGERDPGVVRRDIAELTRRFFRAALFKYASANMYCGGKMAGILNVARFRGDESSLAVARALRTQLSAQGIDWQAFMAEVFDITRILRARFKQSSMCNADQHREMLRLADGKGMMVGVARRFSLHDKWEGHLLASLAASTYATNLQAELLAATGA